MQEKQGGKVGEDRSNKERGGGGEASHQGKEMQTRFQAEERHHDRIISDC